jgi:hypothetical protein
MSFIRLSLGHGEVGILKRTSVTSSNPASSRYRLKLLGSRSDQPAIAEASHIFSLNSMTPESDGVLLSSQCGSGRRHCSSV